MTSRVDRRHRIQAYTVPQVKSAFDTVIFGDRNKRIMSDIFLNGETYEDVAFQYGMSVRGLHYKVKRMTVPVEEYLHKLN